MPISDRQWLIAFSAAVLLHGLLWGAAVWFEQPVRPPVDSPKGVMISLDDFDNGPPSSAIEQQPVEASETGADARPVDTTEAGTAPSDIPDSSAPDIPPATGAPIGPESTAAMVGPDSPNTASSSPSATETPATETGDSAASVTAAVSVTPDSALTGISPTEQVTARDATTSTLPGNTGADRPANGAYGNSTQATDDYIVRLRAWLARHKQYPRSARQAGQQGTVKLYLAINRQGQVLEHRIVKSSGTPALDEAANRMLARALPLPAMPAASRQNRLELVIPIVFTLH